MAGNRYYEMVAALFAAFILSIVVLTDTRQLGFIAALYSFPGGDKLGHFVLFGVLNLLVNLAVFEGWPKQARWRLSVRASAALAVLIGLEELSQRWFPARTSSIWDLAASYLGVVCSAWVAMLVDQRKRVKQTK